MSGIAVLCYYFTNVFDKAVLLPIVNKNFVTGTFDVKAHVLMLIFSCPTDLFPILPQCHFPTQSAGHKLAPDIHLNQTRRVLPILTNARFN